MVSAVISPKIKSIVFGDDQGTTRVRNIDTREQDGEQLEGPTDFVSCLSFLSDCQYPASESYDATIIIRDIDRRKVRAWPLRKYIERDGAKIVVPPVPGGRE